MTPEEFNRMRYSEEESHRVLGEKIVEKMNQDKYRNLDGWYLSSDTFICNDKLPNFTKTIDHHCLTCFLLKSNCVCQDFLQTTTQGKCLP